MTDEPRSAALDELDRAAPPPAPAAGVTRRGGVPPEEATEPDEPLTFLEPPIRPDSLGRLGHYEVLQLVGRGGFGIVFRAFDDVLQRVVAIKVLAPSMAATSAARKRFVREARGYAAIRHENVVQVHAIESDPLPYLVMEFIPGESLEDLLTRTGPLDAPDVVRIGVQLARGLSAAHQTGIIHRDIKPANVLIESGPDRRAKITDFGLARAADDASLTQSGVVAGTPMYMAPEQAAGESLDHRADLFSLGSVLYAMCTGRPPFRATNSFGVLKRVIEDTPRPMREVIPELPPGLCAVIEKLHAKNPADRIQSAAEVAELLGACLTRRRATDAPIVDTPPKAAPAPAPQGVRKPYRWFAPAIGAGVLLVAAVAVLVPRSQTPVADQQPSQPQQPPATKPAALAEFLASPDWEWSAPENLGPNVNGPGRDLTATLTADELTLVFYRNDRLCISRRAAIDESFGPAEPLPDAINTQVRESPSISGDGLVLVFGSTRDGVARIWMSTRATRDAPFGAPVRLPEPVNGSAAGWEVVPVLSGDGLTLLVTTHRLASGPGKGDIWMFTRKTRADAFVSGGPLPVPVNSPGFDIGCWLSDDRRVLVRAKIDQPPHECRFHTRPSPDGTFGPGQSFGIAGDFELGRPWLSPDGTRMYFHSRDLPGGSGELDLWVTRRVPKAR